MNKRPLVIGLGNRFREDDGVGPAVVEKVRAAASTDIDLATFDDVMGVLDPMAERECVVIVDATAPLKTPGKVRRFDGSDLSGFAESDAVSTHALGLANVLRMASALGRMPRRVTVVGIEGVVFGNGEGLSKAVASAVEEAARVVIEEAVCTSSA